MKWNDEQMKGAMKSVLDDGISANKAAVLHGVPCSTLKDYLSRRVIQGRNPYLNPEEEKELAGHLISAADIG